MLTPTPEMKPTITARGTNRSRLPALMIPATTMRSPVRTERVNSVRSGFGCLDRSVSATMIAIAPVTWTAIRELLVNSAAPTLPYR